MKTGEKELALLLKPISILMHQNLYRKSKEVEFEEFKRSAGIFNEDDELFKRVLMPISQLMQMKEEGNQKKFHALQESVKNPIFQSLLQDEEREMIFGKPKAVFKKHQAPLPQTYTDVDLLFDKSNKILENRQSISKSLKDMKSEAKEIEKTIKEISNNLI